MEGITKLQAGEQVDQFLLIKQATKGVTTVGKPFMSLILQDKSGDIEAKLWDTGEEQENLYRAETIVRVGGEIHDYRGKNQLRIKQIRPARPEEGIQIDDLVPSSATPKEELYDELTQFFFENQNQYYANSQQKVLKFCKVLVKVQGLLTLVTSKRLYSKWNLTTTRQQSSHTKAQLQV